MDRPGLQRYPEEFMNAFLIQNDVREAFLFQTIDFNENSPDEPNSRKRLAMIKAEFPQLIHTPMEQGVLISKRAISESEYSTNEALAKILGFPCSLVPGSSYSYSIDVVFNGQQIQLFAFLCPDDRSQQAELLTSKIKTALSKIGNIDVKLRARRIISISDITTKLEKGVALNDEETYEMINYCENLGFSSSFTRLFKERYDGSNPIHTGMVISLLNLYGNNPLEAFYPLQDNTNEVQFVNKKLKYLERSILKSLENSSKVKVVGSRRRKTLRSRR
jgi:hypothetical protein